jgi:hypothetical protein
MSGETGAKVGPSPPPTDSWSVFFFFWGAILWYSQNGDDQQKDIATFGHKINMKRNLNKNILYIFGPDKTYQI